MACRVTFQPAGIRGRVEPGTTVKEAADALGAGIESLCGGRGRCGKCRVRVEGGRGISVPRGDEKTFLSDEDIVEGYRLACLAEIRGDLEVFIPEETQKGRQIILEEGRGIPFGIDPPVEKYYVELGKGERDPEGFMAALAGVGCLVGRMDDAALEDLPDILRDGGVTATVRDGEVIRVEAGVSEGLYGCAVDIGTTTMVCFLVDMRTGKTLAVESMMNPQIGFGEDVMTRLSHVMKHGGQEMQEAIVKGCNGLIERTVDRAGIRADDIVETVVVGNTAMHHLFLGLDISSLGVAPFAPSVKGPMDVKARDVGLKVGKGSCVHALPNVAGFVGADNVAACLATEPFGDGTALLMDIGTNGEIVLGNESRVVAASCATGPALEGGHIGAGMRAAPGAIEHADVEDGRMRFSVIGGGKPRGICGSGLIDIVAGLCSLGTITRDGGLDPSSARVRKGKEGLEYLLVEGRVSATGRDIVLSKKDIAEVQLAKAALFGGCRVLMNEMGIKTGEIQKVYLAGAFGSRIRAESALAIGMLPPVEPAKMEVVGNAAGEGAKAALLSRERRERAREIARKVGYVELTTNPDFEEAFVRALRFP
jgi:uncharacterized 2Fe-2S/4Fe-4S cluster protein (DUF4445 family)